MKYVVDVVLDGGADPTGVLNSFQEFRDTIALADIKDAAEIFIPEGKYLLIPLAGADFIVDVIGSNLPFLKRFRGAGSGKTTLIIGWEPPATGLAEGPQIRGLFRFIDMADVLLEGLTFDVRNTRTGSHRMHTQGGAARGRKNRRVDRHELCKPRGKRDAPVVPIADFSAGPRTSA